MSAEREKKTKDARPPEPVDVVDGIADRSPNPAPWKYVVLLVIFLAWIALLIFMKVAGSAQAR